eukprot:TRINITY_DN67716_c8_g1_i1.p1 TRINITY_DN67716_c8_g1~~TRINITY_DN67716_c8_g1_i1.p1  ORF type:complete len:687 (-),score=32.92 TRINITY_DN67716_c8_g1_i1:882-2813(-)
MHASARQWYLNVAAFLVPSPGGRRFREALVGTSWDLQLTQQDCAPTVAATAVSSTQSTSSIMDELRELQRAEAEAQRLAEEWQDKASRLAFKVQSAESKLKAAKAKEIRNRNLKKHHWASDHFMWDKRLKTLLREQFDLPAFRPLQREVVNALLSRHDVFLNLPTGTGKSLCFQLLAWYYSKGTVLVVCPLLSLMEDQVYAARKLGLSAELLAGQTPQDVRNKILQGVLADDYTNKTMPRIHLLYLTPELLCRSKPVLNALKEAYEQDKLRLLVVDECHCCSEWGYDFRPDYRNLALLKIQFPRVPMLALTATASPCVQADVEECLGISQGVSFRGDYNRPNLFYCIKPKAKKAASNVNDIVEWIKAHRAANGPSSGIVYCLTRRDTVVVNTMLKLDGISSAFYHSGLTNKERTKVQDEWMADKTDVMVATSAFGLGINKSNVRFVVHHTIPKSIESWYQESGRAGRDGKRSDCVLFYRPSDVCRVARMVVESNSSKHRDATLKSLYRMVEFVDGEDSFETCRRKVLADYFSYDWHPSHCAKMCDVCDGAFTVASLEPADDDEEDDEDDEVEERPTKKRKCVKGSARTPSTGQKKIRSTKRKVTLSSRKKGKPSAKKSDGKTKTTKKTKKQKLSSTKKIDKSH